MNVQNLCSHDVCITYPSTRLVDAARQMREAHVGALVACEEVDGRTRPIGVLTDRDIVVSVLAEDVPRATHLLVGDVLFRDVITADAHEDAMVVARRMRERGVRRMPVVDGNGDLVGIVTADDLIAAISAELGQIANLLVHQPKRESVMRS